MRSLLVLGSILALVASSTALANHLDPQKKIRPADQARARAMLLKKADLPGFQVDRSPDADTHLSCTALDESDLTLTGKADSPAWTAGLASVSSAAQIYGSVGDADASWRRGTRAAGTTCLKSELRREFAQEAIQLRSLRKVAFPRVSQRTVAYRVVLSGQSQGVTVQVFVDLVVLMHSRAQVALFFGSALSPPARSAEVGLARLTAKRMLTAMRGS